VTALAAAAIAGAVAGRTLTIRPRFVPYAHQREAHAARKAKRFVVLVWHRRGGKTVFAVEELVLEALACKRERGQYGYIAPQLKQAKGVAWAYLRQFTADIPGCTVNESELSVLLPNGAIVRLFGADNPDSLRGWYFDGVVLDEVADMRPQTWGEIIRAALSDRHGWALFIGTPKGINLFSELYYAALKDDEWHADLRRADQTGVIAAEELVSARKSMSAAQYAQEFDCDFGAANAQALIPLDVALAAARRSCREDAFESAAKVIGVDVARYGDARSVFFPRQGCVAFAPRVFRAISTMELVGHLCQMIQDWEPDAVFIDATGVGGPVVDRMKELGHAVVGVDAGQSAISARYQNKRAECWYLMREWLASGCIPDDSSLLAELTGLQYTFANAAGKLQLESKDDLRDRGMPSPDLGDALSLTFSHPVVSRKVRASPEYSLLTGGLQRSRGADYNPLARERR
jgi:hypothetical protein